MQRKQRALTPPERTRPPRRPRTPACTVVHICLRAVSFRPWLSLPAVGDFERRFVGRFWRRLRVYGAAGVGVAGRAGVAAAHLAGAWLLEHGT